MWLGLNAFHILYTLLQYQGWITFNTNKMNSFALIKNIFANIQNVHYEILVLVKNILELTIFVKYMMLDPHIILFQF